MSKSESYIKTYVREANLRLYYLIFSWVLCFVCCYLKSSQIIYLIIKPTLNQVRLPCQMNGQSQKIYNHAPAKATTGQGDNSLCLLETKIKSENLAAGATRQDHGTATKLEALREGYFLNNSPQQPDPFSGCTYDFIYTNVTEAFYATLEAAITFSILFTLPLFIYHLWSFLMPSRYNRERSYLNRGALQLLAYLMFFLWLIVYQLLPHICQFLHLFAVQTGKLQIINQARIAPYLSWIFNSVFTLLLASCTPLCIYLGLKHDFLSLNFLIENRRTTAYLLLILAALLSPPDLWSQLSICLCLFLFFECVIWLSLYKIKTQL